LKRNKLKECYYEMAGEDSREEGHYWSWKHCYCTLKNKRFSV